MDRIRQLLANVGGRKPPLRFGKVTSRHDHDPGDKATAGYEVSVGANCCQACRPVRKGWRSWRDGAEPDSAGAGVHTPGTTLVLARKRKKSGAIVRYVNWFTLPGFLHSIITDDSLSSPLTDQRVKPRFHFRPLSRTGAGSDGYVACPQRVANYAPGVAGHGGAVKSEDCHAGMHGAGPTSSGVWAWSATSREQLHRQQRAAFVEAA